jgi:hypothetical protein
MNPEPKWDAQTLAEANVIRSDPARLAAAQQAAQELAKEEAEKAAAMKKVAKQKSDPVRTRSGPAIGHHY